MTRLARWVAGAYPAGFLAAYVLLSFSGTPTPLQGLWRPLLVAVTLSISLQLVVAVITRSWRLAGLITSLILMVFAAAWLPAAVVAAIAVWWMLTNVLRRRSGRPPMRLAVARSSEAMAVFAVALAAFAALPVASRAAAAVGPDPDPIGPTDTASPGPDILVLLLDGYPRADALEEQFGHDNGAFVEALRDRDFTVMEDSRSNYTATWATIASMLHMRYVNEIDVLSPPPSDAAEQYRRLMSAIGSAPGVGELVARGYEILTIPSPFESAALVTADAYLDGGHLTSFELSLIQHSTIGRLVLSLRPELFFDSHRTRVIDAFDTTADVMGQPGERPRFLLAHVLTPHAPTVFNADGSPAEPMACFPDCSPWAFTSLEQWDAFPPQVVHVNRLVLETVDAVIAGNPDSVVVVMSDHGSQVPGQDSANVFRTLFAARTPGVADGLVDASPVNLLPQLLNRYFDTEIALQPYRAWRSEFAAPLTMEPATDQEP